MQSIQIIRAAVGIGIGIIAILVLNYTIKRNKALKKNLNHRYVLHLIRLFFCVICLVNVIKIVDPKFDTANVLLKGSALAVAILGFAAQTAISDIICGMLISFNKPFEVGDRIIVEGQEPGIVEDITLRHTVIRIYDDIRIIVPNSQLNAKTVINTSYNKTDRRGIHLKYSVSYDTDVQKAMDIIRDCVVASPYTLTVESNGISEDSGAVYFLEFADSALILETTIWVRRTTSSYTAITDMNMRVNSAFKKYGIEIPYNYMNVVRYEGAEKAEIKDLPVRTVNSPAKRHYRTDTVRIVMGKKDITKAVEAARTYGKRQSLSTHDTRQLELLTEETIGVIENIVDDITARFWIEGSGFKYRIHLCFDAKVGSREYRKLISLSTSGKNEADNGLSGKIMGIILRGMNDIADSGSEEDKKKFNWALSENRINEEEIGESILTAIASDIRVSVTKDKVEFLVIKTTQK